MNDGGIDGVLADIYTVLFNLYKNSVGLFNVQVWNAFVEVFGKAVDNV